MNMRKRVSLAGTLSTLAIMFLGVACGGTQATVLPTTQTPTTTPIDPNTGPTGGHPTDGNTAGGNPNNPNDPKLPSTSVPGTAPLNPNGNLVTNSAFSQGSAADWRIAGNVTFLPNAAEPNGWAARLAASLGGPAMLSQTVTIRPENGNFVELRFNERISHGSTMGVVLDGESLRPAFRQGYSNDANVQITQATLGVSGGGPLILRFIVDQNNETLVIQSPSESRSIVLPGAAPGSYVDLANVSVTPTKGP